MVAIAKPIKSLELHYAMTQFFSNNWRYLADSFATFKLITGVEPGREAMGGAFEHEGKRAKHG